MLKNSAKPQAVARETRDMREKRDVNSSGFHFTRLARPAHPACLAWLLCQDRFSTAYSIPAIKLMNQAWYQS
jgi:hypothetical protein